eukprot:g7865.t1
MSGKPMIITLACLVGNNKACNPGKYSSPGRRLTVDEDKNSVSEIFDRQLLSGRRLSYTCTCGRNGCPSSSTCEQCRCTGSGCTCSKERPPPCIYDCEAGRYGNKNGQDEATQCGNSCPAGKYGGNKGQTTEKTACLHDCPAGKYGFQWAQYIVDACNGICPQGKYGKKDSELNGKTRDSIDNACTDCPKGSYCTGDGTETKCPAGRYGNVLQAGSEAAGCSGTCPKGMHVKKNAGTGKTTREDACETCDVDHYCPGNNTFIACPNGYNTLGAKGKSSPTACQLCTSNCKACPINTYGGNGRKCEFCPNKAPTTNGVTGARQRFQCTTCKMGYGFSNYGLAFGKCVKCPSNHKGIGYGPCVECSVNELASPGSSECFNPGDLKKQFFDSMDSISARQGDIITDLAESNAKSEEVKQKANGLTIKLSRDWATDDVIRKAQKMRDELALTAPYNVHNHCEQEKERLAYGVLRTAFIVPQDAEIDDKYCLNVNRDMLISSFCNFRTRFIKLLEEKFSNVINPIPTGRELWPNICCKTDNFQNLKSCNDPAGNVPRSEIVPFALAQGGNLTVKNLYGEIIDIIRWNGYLQTGMSKAIQGLVAAPEINKKLDLLFQNTLLCGPREFGLPSNEEIRLCELFYPYEHMLNTFYDEVEAKYHTFRRRRQRQLLGDSIWSSIGKFVNSASKTMFGSSTEENDEEDRMDEDINGGMRSLQDEVKYLKHQVTKQQNEIHALKKAEKKNNHFLVALKQNANNRRLGSNPQFCPVKMSSREQLEDAEKTLCVGYAHIDLNHPDSIVNLAIMMPWTIPKEMIQELRYHARYEISDECPTKMFSPDDISLQNIDGKDLFIVKLDSKSPNGYLKKELPQCGAVHDSNYMPHIPRTTIDVKLWRDHDRCCPNTKDYNECVSMGCTKAGEANNIDKVTDEYTKNQVGYTYVVTGTTYDASCDSKPSKKSCKDARRRRLLQDEYGNSGERKEEAYFTKE